MLFCYSLCRWTCWVFEVGFIASLPADETFVRWGRLNKLEGIFYFFLVFFLCVGCWFQLLEQEVCVFLGMQRRLLKFRLPLRWCWLGWSWRWTFCAHVDVDDRVIFISSETVLLHRARLISYARWDKKSPRLLKLLVYRLMTLQTWNLNLQGWVSE